MSAEDKEDHSKRPEGADRAASVHGGRVPRLAATPQRRVVAAGGERRLMGLGWGGVDTNFKQQRLKAWQPLLTPVYVIGTFFVVGIVFIILGAVIYSASSKV